MSQYLFFHKDEKGIIYRPISLIPYKNINSLYYKREKICNDVYGDLYSTFPYKYNIDSTQILYIHKLDICNKEISKSLFRYELYNLSSHEMIYFPSDTMLIEPYFVIYWENNIINLDYGIYICNLDADKEKMIIRKK